MSAANPMTVMVGGSHYLKYRIQPTEFWLRNQLPAAEGSIVKYLTRHPDKAGRMDVEKCIDFLNKMLWFYFDGPIEVRTVPMHWRGQCNYAITPEHYCVQNELPAQETAAILLTLEFARREDLLAAIEVVREIIARDYATVRTIPAGELNHSDVLYLAKQQLENDLTLLEVRTAMTPAYRGKLKGVIDRVAAAWRQSASKAAP